MKTLQLSKKMKTKVGKNPHELQMKLWEMYVRDNLPLKNIYQELHMSDKTILKLLDGSGLYSRKLNLKGGDAESAD